MFGISTFSQVPFASLPSTGGANFFEFLTEAFGIADNNTQLFTFSETRTESITVEDLNSQGSILIFTLNENLILIMQILKRLISYKVSQSLLML
jgi:hypothetical protein